METKYYVEELKLDGTARELFIEARNGYYESLDALAKIQEILLLPSENKVEEAFYVGVLKEIVELEDSNNQKFAYVKKDLLDEVQPEEFIEDNKFCIQFMKEFDNVCVSITDTETLTQATSFITYDKFINMSAEEINGFVNETWFYNQVEIENDLDVLRACSTNEIASKLEQFAFENDFYHYMDSEGISDDKRSAFVDSLVVAFENKDINKIEGIREWLNDFDTSEAENLKTVIAEKYLSDRKEVSSIYQKMKRLEKGESFKTQSHNTKQKEKNLPSKDMIEK